MDFAEFWNLFLENLANTGFLEIVAVFFGLLSVWYAKKASILVYPTGIISVLIYVYICFYAGLYADMGINAFYFIMSVYGWLIWSLKKQGKEQRPVTKNSIVINIGSIIITAVLFLILSVLLTRYTDSTVPLWDSLTTAIFITGMWLMALKKLENWIYWIVGDVISVPLYFNKELVFSSFQFFVFLILAVMGFVQWRKIIKEQHSELNQNEQ